MRRFVVILMVCALALLAFSATANAGHKARPFKGSAVGQVTFTPGTAEDPNDSPWNPPYGMWTNSYAVGTAAHLGACVLTARHPTPGGTDIAGGTMKIVAANGAEVWITYTGFAPLPTTTTDVFPVDLDFTIVGGTGRFDSATGGGEMTVWVTFQGYDDFEWPATFEWSGCRIRY